jgi:hypothetical protein
MRMQTKVGSCYKISNNNNSHAEKEATAAS